MSKYQTEWIEEAMEKHFIGKRVREEREACHLTVNELSEKMGWASHTTVVDLEAGRRELKAWELMKLARILHVDAPALLSEKVEETGPLVLWRERPQEHKELLERQFIQRCEEYKFLEEILENKLPRRLNLPKEALDLKKADFAWANELADRVCKEMRLGDFPGSTLLKTLEENYGVRFLALSLGENGSAACCDYIFGPAILINSDEVPWRQTFSVAHELFHLITWDIAIFSELANNKKNEQLANAFAAGILMPSTTLRQQFDKLVQQGKLKYSTIVALAREYGVSSSALLYRLEYLNLISKPLVEKMLSDPRFKAIDKQSFTKAFAKAIPPGDRFIRLAYLAYQFAKISRSRLARLLHVSIPNLESYLATQGLYEVDDEELTLSNP